MAVQVPTSPNVCFYTTWGKQNKRNMHRNEQETSTNWRLDHVKNLVTAVSANEVHRLLTYCSTSCYQMRHWWVVTRSCFSSIQRTSASAREAIKLLECEIPDRLHLSRSVVPNSPDINLVDYWGHATAGLSDDVQKCGWTQEATGWNLDWSRTLLTLLSTHARNWLHACVRAKGRDIEHWL